MGVDSENNLGYGMIWLDIETNPSHNCGWELGDQHSNCDFVKQIISTLETHGKKVGIYASEHMWQVCMKSKAACPELGKYPLWYAHYDNSQTFADFRPFGGWKTPSIK